MMPPQREGDDVGVLTQIQVQPAHLAHHTGHSGLAIDDGALQLESLSCAA